MERRGFFGSLVVTMFSLPKIVKQITAEKPDNAIEPSVSIPTTWSNNLNSTWNTNMTVYPPYTTGTAGLTWYPTAGGF